MLTYTKKPQRTSTENRKKRKRERICGKAAKQKRENPLLFLLTKAIRGVIIDTWLIPTNRQNLHILGNTIGIKRGVQTLLIISQYGRGSSGYQTLGPFYYPYVATEYGTREYTCQSVKFRTAEAVECAGVTAKTAATSTAKADAVYK